MITREPLNPAAVDRLAKVALKGGSISFSQHARDEMEKDRLTDVDIANVIRGGFCEGAGELIQGSWRYRMRTQRIVVVIAFRSDVDLRVVTAWRTGR